MDFKKPSIFSQFAERKMSGNFVQIAEQHAAARGNGVSRFPSVPAVDRMALSVALSRVAEIEKTLEAARDAARVAARRAGVKLGGLFGQTDFVSRATAERWADEAREEGAEERNRLIIRAFSQPRNPALQAWGDKMLRRRRAAGFADDVELTDDQATALLRGTVVSAGDPDALAEAAAAARITAEATIKAEQILAAAALRDAGGPALPAPTGKAKRILDAAAKVHRRE